MKKYYAALVVVAALVVAAVAVAAPPPPKTFISPLEADQEVPQFAHRLMDGELFVRSLQPRR